jgi:hypothetical protein
MGRGISHKNLRGGIAATASMNFGPRWVALGIEQIECAAARKAQSMRKSDSNLHCLFGRSGDRYQIKLKRACELIASPGVRRL